MIDEHKALTAKERGARADALLNNELFKETIKTIEAAYIKAWAGTAPQEADARENYYRALQILADVQNHLKKTAADGKVANRDLDDLANKFRPRAA